MLTRRLVTIATLSSLLALAMPARAACVSARQGLSVARLPAPWQAAIDQLICSTAEPGQPWSCAGGTVDVDLASWGSVLRVAREEKENVVRTLDGPAPPAVLTTTS